jgi:hypothetical protein
MNRRNAVYRNQWPILADNLPLLHDTAKMHAMPTGGLWIVGTVAQGGAGGRIRSFIFVALPVQIDSRAALRSGCKDWPVNELRRFF